mgnify:CR=1 FL=1
MATTPWLDPDEQRAWRTYLRLRLLENLLAFNVGVEIGQFLALCVILIAMSFWRRSASFMRYATAANVLLLLSGVALVIYQVKGYVTALPA